MSRSAVLKAADEDGAVATEGIALRAHERDTQTLGSSTNSLQTLEERGLPRQGAILHLDVDVVIGIGAADTEFATEKHIGHAGGAELRLERVPIELRIAAAEGR